MSPAKTSWRHARRLASWRNFDELAAQFPAPVIRCAIQNRYRISMGMSYGAADFKARGFYALGFNRITPDICIPDEVEELLASLR